MKTRGTSSVGTLSKMAEPFVRIRRYRHEMGLETLYPKPNLSNRTNRGGFPERRTVKIIKCFRICYAVF